MKNNHILIENSLTYVILLYYQKSYPFINKFFFKRMVVEMLLNNDIQLFFCSNDFKISKGNKFNYVHYWIFKKKTRIISFEQNLNKIRIFKVYVYVMFKMKYLINRM